MDFNKHKKNNFLKENNFENEKKPTVENIEILTNIEAFELGKFPDNLVEKVTLPKLYKENYIDSEIKLTCSGCEKEYRSDIDLDPTNFFT